MAQILILERDGTEIAAVPLAGGDVDVGAAQDNTLRLHGPGIRPHHLVLRRRQHGWWAVGRYGPVRDDKGRDAPEIRLLPGKRIAVGPYRLSLVREERPAGGMTVSNVHERTRPLGKPSVPPLGLPRLLLRYLGPDGQTQRRVLSPGTTVLGRSPACDVVLDDPSVSARHARIVVDEHGAVLEDLASLNGCWIDDRRVWVADLGPGVTLRLGAVEVQVVGERAGHAGERLVARPVFPPGLRATLEALRVAAPSREPCLLLGETGSGKEVLARQLHQLGPRRNGPFVALSGAALPLELAESLLFGHHRGAFTGAVDRYRGAFERADGGTLFLDEVGELGPELQAKLLRVIEEGVVLPLGSEQPVAIDVRLVAATNRDLVAAVREGWFRVDLWHRLSVFVVPVPPLRRRPGDVGPLAEAILESLAPETGPRRLSPAALKLLRRYRWPGNVRELRNVLVRAAMTTRTEWIEAATIRAALGADQPTLVGDVLDPLAWLADHGGNVTAAARAAGLPRSTFRDMLAARRRAEQAMRTGAARGRRQAG